MAFTQKRSSSFLPDCLVTFSRYPAMTAFAGVATLMAAAAIANRHYAKKAQRDNPPRGRFIDIDGFICTTWSAAMAGRWFLSTATAA